MVWCAPPASLRMSGASIGSYRVSASSTRGFGLTGTCSGPLALRSASAWRVCWKRTADSFGRFSDNGRRIIGYDDRRDGIGDGFADVLNSRTGRIQVRARVPVNGYIGQVLWEDNDSVVVNAWVNGRAQLYRVNASGTWKRIARALRSADVDNPYRLVE